MRIPISPAVRWVLANLFLHRGLSINGGISQDTTYNRTRAALGLRAPMNVLLKGLDANIALVHDTESSALCNLTDENRDFLLDRIFPLEKHPYQVACLESFTEAMLDWKRGLLNDYDDSVPALPHVSTLTEQWIATKDKGDN